MPHRCGLVTAMTAAAATAASAAVPPRSRAPTPAIDANWSAAQTMPRQPVRGGNGASGKLTGMAYHGPPAPAPGQRSWRLA